jgi:hypothetical protein
MDLLTELVRPLQPQRDNWSKDQNTHTVNVKAYPIIDFAYIHTDNGSSRIMIGLKVVNLILEYGLQERFMGNFTGDKLENSEDFGDPLNGPLTCLTLP